MRSLKETSTEHVIKLVCAEKSEDEEPLSSKFSRHWSPNRLLVLTPTALPAAKAPPARTRPGPGPWHWHWPLGGLAGVWGWDGLKLNAHQTLDLCCLLDICSAVV